MYYKTKLKVNLYQTPNSTNFKVQTKGTMNAHLCFQCCQVPNDHSSKSKGQTEEGRGEITYRRQAESEADRLMLHLYFNFMKESLNAVLFKPLPKGTEYTDVKKETSPHATRQQR